QEGINVLGVDFERVGVWVSPRAVAVSTQIRRDDMMVRPQSRRDKVEPMRMCRPAVHAQHWPTPCGAVIQVVEIDAVRFDETARAGCGVKVGHCLASEVMVGTPNSTENLVLPLLSLELPWR